MVTRYITDTKDMDEEGELVSYDDYLTLKDNNDLLKYKLGQGLRYIKIIKKKIYSNTSNSMVDDWIKSIETILKEK